MRTQRTNSTMRWQHWKPAGAEENILNYGNSKWIGGRNGPEIRRYGGSGPVSEECDRTNVFEVDFRWWQRRRWKDNVQVKRLNDSTNLVRCMSWYRFTISFKSL
jgi:hypothetical protein